jgi:hypothetical protein
MMKAAILVATMFASALPAQASLVVTSTDNVSAGMAAFGPATTLFDWRHLFDAGAGWTTGTFGGPAVVSTSVTDPVTGTIASGDLGTLYITNWLDGPGFSGAAAAAPDLAISGIESFTLTFAAPVQRVGFAVSTGVGLLPGEFRNTGTSFIVTTDTTSSGGFTLFDMGSGGTWWITIESLEPFTSLVVAENPVFNDDIWDQYFGNIVGAAIPEPASWALMIAGFGLVGGAMRRRRAVGATGRAMRA